MRIIYLTIAFTLLVFSGLTQTIKVINKTNLQAVENVYIFNQTSSVLTDKKGEADISSFSKEGQINFQHPSFKTFQIEYAQLTKSDFKVELTESMIHINEIVLSANRWEQNTEELPNKINIISASSVAFTNPQTTADLLGSSNEVFIQKSQLGGGSPMIRGFSTNRILMVVDGVRMNNAIYRSGNLQNVLSLDANSIQNTEVIFGPGSIIYGSDAIGGVMDFHTLEAQTSYSEATRFNGNALMRYSSANNEKTAHVDFNIGTKKWAFLSSFTFSDFDNLKMGTKGNDEYIRTEYVDQINGKDTVIKNNNENVQKFSAYSQINLMQKIRFKPNKKWDINYGFHYSTLSDVPRYDRLLEYSNNKLKYGEWYYGPQNWMMNALTINYKDTTLLFDRAKLIIAQQNYKESRHDRKFGKDEIREQYENVDILSANLDFEKHLSDKSWFFYGIEGIGNKVKSTGHMRNIYTSNEVSYASRYPDGSTWMSFAGYANYKINPVKQLTFIAGLRYNQVILNADFDTTFYKFPFNNININTKALNGSLGMVYRPAKSWQFNLNTSSGFRAPNIDDIGKVFDSEPGNVIVPNKDLDSEYAYNIDFSVIKTFNNRVKIEATAFYTFLKDAMVRRDFTFNGQDSIPYDGEMSKVQALVNVGEATAYGIQAGIFADITNYLAFSSNINYTKGEDVDGFPLRHAAPLFGSTHLIFNTKGLKADLYANYNGEIAFENLPPEEQGKTYMYATDDNGNPYSPSWATLNFKASYQINKNLQANAGIENILDARYRPYSSGIVSPGRNFIVGLRGSF